MQVAESFESPVRGGALIFAKFESNDP